MGNKLYVGNLNFSTSEDALRAAFAANGRTVREVAIPSDRETGRPRGFAFVTMGSDADAKAAIAALDGKDLDGRALRVNEAQDRPPRSGGGGGYGNPRERPIELVKRDVRRGLVSRQSARDDYGVVFGSDGKASRRKDEG